MKKNRGRGLNYSLTILWLLSMALAGYFFPYFVDSIGFFKIKALHIEGVETIPPQVIIEEVNNFKNNWLFIEERVLLESLKERTNNAIKDINIKRVFTTGGIVLKIKVQERKAIFCVVEGDRRIFFDEMGEAFQSPYIDLSMPLIYSQDINLIAQNFNIALKLINTTKEELREVYATKLNTIVYLKDGTKLVLPALLHIDEKVLYYLGRMKAHISKASEIKIFEKDLIIIR